MAEYTRSSYRFIVPFAILLFISGCDIINTKNDDDDEGGIVANSLLIGNQGEFGAGNGTITRYDPATNSAVTAFRDLETIIQSIEVDGDLLFIAANTGGRIDILNHKSGEFVAQVEGLISPRYMSVGADEIYVTNLYGSTETFTGGVVSVIDRSTYRHITEIQVGDNPEGIARVGNRVFVANQGFGYGSTVSIIDATDHSLETIVDVGCDGPRYLIPDSDSDIFVTCTGQTIYDESFNEVGSTPGEIVVLDGLGRVQRRLEVEGRMMAAEFGQDAFFDAANERIFALNERDGTYFILVIDTRTNSISDEIGPLDGTIGSVAYDAEEDVLYVGRISTDPQRPSPVEWYRLSIDPPTVTSLKSRWATTPKELPGLGIEYSWPTRVSATAAQSRSSMRPITA